MTRETVRKIWVIVLAIVAVVAGILSYKIFHLPQFVMSFISFLSALFFVRYKNPRFTKRKQDILKYGFIVLSVVFFLLTIGNFLVWMGIIQDIPLF
ncbi:MAG: hypothetical protein B7Y25_00485 [Alphaproteobacteria bacterium 16-39-46]|nr:MAG: hypothetical protein B7Y25_00485 [Alphaproteobacteria bacterium 16-39-46]OZA44420.1 MAG: hypothetical protein B7X84_00430 [Alphaproteobacteria bacterium 17-39-52]HQS83307.1 hypothetical protein [Alphaproteobacteria bacterium]HQS93151.1 hypothetical protein [Alphaproteobacteria bacterium]